MSSNNNLNYLSQRKITYIVMVLTVYHIMGPCIFLYLFTCAHKKKKKKIKRRSDNSEHSRVSAARDTYWTLYNDLYLDHHGTRSKGQGETFWEQPFTHFTNWQSSPSFTHFSNWQSSPSILWPSPQAWTQNVVWVRTLYLFILLFKWISVTFFFFWRRYLPLSHCLGSIWLCLSFLLRPLSTFPDASTKSEALFSKRFFVSLFYESIKRKLSNGNDVVAYVECLRQTQCYYPMCAYLT